MTDAAFVYDILRFPCAVEQRLRTYVLSAQTDKLMVDTREEAIGRLQENAAAQGANAVVGVRMTTSNIAQSASEVMVFGTAVEVE
mmetsp:Transcript_95586/g.209026  ORF Transcript_95586/g.209026 Transcript_95586/m.209026 type:complete len:85 (+) Transcript_95586:418-672(+)